MGKVVRVFMVCEGMKIPGDRILGLGICCDVEFVGGGGGGVGTGR